MRTLAGTLAVLCLAALWLGPLIELSRSAFWAHMTMHMGVVAVAAPLGALALARGRLDPVCRRPHWFPPVPASVIELVVVWAWHTPLLHHAARHTLTWLVLEQASFLASGLYVWLAVFGGLQSERRARTGAGMLALLLTSMHMTLLGALLALAPRPLFAHAAGAAGGLSALADQQLGGAIMLLVGGLSYLAGGLWLGVQLLQRRDERAEVGPAALSRRWRETCSDPTPEDRMSTPLRDLARYLAEIFKDTPAVGAVVGRTSFRDALVRKLDCSQLEAEKHVDDLVASKHLVFEGSHGEPGVWHVRPDADFTR